MTDEELRQSLRAEGWEVSGVSRPPPVPNELDQLAQAAASTPGASYENRAANRRSQRIAMVLICAGLLVVISLLVRPLAKDKIEGAQRERLARQADAAADLEKAKAMRLTSRADARAQIQLMIEKGAVYSASYDQEIIRVPVAVWSHLKVGEKQAFVRLCVDACVHQVQIMGDRNDTVLADGDRFGRIRIHF